MTISKEQEEAADYISGLLCAKADTEATKTGYPIEDCAQVTAMAFGICYGLALQACSPYPEAVEQTRAAFEHGVRYGTTLGDSFSKMLDADGVPN